MSHPDYVQKMAVAQQFREAALRLAGEVRDMSQPLPANIKMVLGATDRDFLIAQHRGVTRPEVVTAKIEEMEESVDAIARHKLGAMAIRYDSRQAQD